MRKTRLGAITLALIRERTVESNGCWLWQGARSRGYAMVQWFLDGRTRPLRVHRLSYVLVNGPVRPGLELDHVCRVRHCVNPEHLEAVTPRENQRRGVSPAGINMTKGQCPMGHPYQTLVPGRRGPVLNQITGRDERGRHHRRCRLCFNAWSRARRRACSFKMRS